MQCRNSFMALCILLFHSAAAQLQIDVQIANPSGGTITLDPNALNSQASSQGVAGAFVNVQTDTVTQLVAQQCQPGTFSQTTTVNGVTTQTCVNCAAGTASTAIGASDASTCVPCTTGAFAIERSSVCTDCAANTFSVTPAGPSPSVCLQCPPYTTSPVHSNSVDNCICNAGYFQSDNVLKAFPYAAVPISLGFEGAAGIDFSHVLC